MQSAPAALGRPQSAMLASCPTCMCILIPWTLKTKLVLKIPTAIPDVELVQALPSSTINPSMEWTLTHLPLSRKSSAWNACQESSTLDLPAMLALLDALIALSIAINYGNTLPCSGIKLLTNCRPIFKTIMIQILLCHSFLNSSVKVASPHGFILIWS